MNDAIIDLFYSLLDRREEILNKNKQSSKCLFLRTSFMTFLYQRKEFPVKGDNGEVMKGKTDIVHEYEYSNVRPWTNKKVDIFEFNKIFIPVHVPGYWFCMVIFTKEQTIEVLDSLCEYRGKHLEIVFQYLSDEHQHRKNKPLPGKCCSDNNILHQTNGWDCGVYTCMNADRLSQTDKDEFKKDGISTIY